VGIAGAKEEVARGTAGTNCHCRFQLLPISTSIRKVFRFGGESELERMLIGLMAKTQSFTWESRERVAGLIYVTEESTTALLRCHHPSIPRLISPESISSAVCVCNLE